jgi:hypothetical protein
MNRLIRQLQREFRARPGKAALLGALVLVAAAVVLPRLWGMVCTGEAPAASPPADVTAAATGPATQAPAAPRLSWQELAALLEQSPNMKPLLAKASSGRDPFANLADAAAEQAAQKAEEAPVDQPPSALGLALTSTIVGGRRDLAIISGKVYERGARVPAAQDIVFELVEIHRERVALARGGRVYELKLERAKQGGAASVRPVPSSSR